MKELLDKISSYNIFNYLFPGIIFVCILKYLTNYNLIQDNDIIGAFLYYFIGMIISRIGSLVVEPVLIKIHFLKFADYKDFIAASNKDEKIELLSEINNTYRTIVAMILLLLSIQLYIYLKTLWHIQKNVSILIMAIFVLVMFIFAYRKQTNYIKKRIAANN